MDKRRLFIGGHMDGKIQTFPADYHVVKAMEQLGPLDWLNDDTTAIDPATYVLKYFAAGSACVGVFVLNYNVTADEILTALAHAAGVDTE